MKNDSNKASILNLKTNAEISVQDLVSDLCTRIEKIKSEQNAKGQLFSGNTIHRVVLEAHDCVEQWYQAQLSHIQKLPFQDSQEVAEQILLLIDKQSGNLYQQVLSLLNPIVKLAGISNPERTIEKAHSGFAQSKIRFTHMFRTHMISLKSRSDKPQRTGFVTSALNIDSKAAWDQIQAEYGVTKKAFGKRIAFVSDAFSRKIIFRDIENAFVLAVAGFSKPAAILAGGVIEELLRQYLGYKGVVPATDSFDSYIKTCADKGFVKSEIRSLSDSFRLFRNIVHLKREQTPRHTISQATAKGAVSSIFTISNDFQK